MEKVDLLNKIYNRGKTALDFHFDELQGPHPYDVITPYDECLINEIINDPKLNTEVKKKLDYIKEILQRRNFIRLAGGTNRIAYRYKENNSFIIKVGFDVASLGDSPAEYANQHLIKPFVTKVFGYSQTGVFGTFERVKGFTSVQQFANAANEIFDLLRSHFLGRYVMDDIGTKKFKNWGIRIGFGPVLLDFPWVYPLDGKKLICKDINYATGQPCHGIIDYDYSFDNLICTRCGRLYQANDLKVTDSSSKIGVMFDNKEVIDMVITIRNNGKVVSRSEDVETVQHFSDLTKARKREEERKNKTNEDVLEHLVIKNASSDYQKDIKTEENLSSSVSELEGEEKSAMYEQTPENAYDAAKKYVDTNKSTDYQEEFQIDTDDGRPKSKRSSSKSTSAKKASGKSTSASTTATKTTRKTTKKKPPFPSTDISTPDPVGAANGDVDAEIAAKLKNEIQQEKDEMKEFSSKFGGF